MSYITAIGIAVPKFRFDQATISEFMVKTMSRDTATARKIKAVFRASGIQFRHSVLEDYGRTSEFSFYPNDPNATFPGTEKRMKIFRKNALQLSLDAVNDLSSRRKFLAASITHLIVVSCTGLYAPGLDIELVKALGLSYNVHRTCVQFMGCYAAFNALKVADAICNGEQDRKVLIVCTELCSIHFQQDATEDNILANALFGDGSASILVESAPAQGLNLEINSFYCDLAFRGESDMAWHIGDAGFEMRLSSYIPDLIKSEVPRLIDGLLSLLNKQRQDVAHYALHPGGKKILETIEQELEINHEHNSSAYDVLRNYGNMSSATVVFVLRKICEKLRQTNNGEHILSMGFGPGLTLESMLLKIQFS